MTRPTFALPGGEVHPMDPISEALGRHYAETFDRHGPTSQGVDWGADAARAELRYDKMLAVMPRDPGPRPSLLDVGCGYGGLLTHAARKGLTISYTGIDVAGNMIQWAAASAPNGHFLQGDVLSHEFGDQFDYVVCNGILTQKLNATGLEMDRYAGRLIRRLFELCRRGVAFNVMTTKVNHFANNLYYRNPAELLSWCLSEITPHLRLDHSYPLYEYTMYLYREPYAG
jgi:SAM-dependent methyltransferase